ncbi:hypothetical protein TcCL_Unassigned05439 [Trypanosoma cruzi]|nr:hypothetical protein TcCL_Unassigned05439 [Trypanosoma cruzi]
MTGDDNSVSSNFLLSPPETKTSPPPASSAAIPDTAPQHAEGTHQQQTASHHRHHSCHLRVAFSKSNTTSTKSESKKIDTAATPRRVTNGSTPAAAHTPRDRWNQYDCRARTPHRKPEV